MALPGGQNNRFAAAAEALALLTAAGMYIHAAAPTVTTAGDHGELALACLDLTAGHPPGYPLYICLGKAFSACVPLGGTAFRLNLLSAFMAALAVWTVVRLVNRIAQSLPAGIAAGACLACSSTFFSQAVITEVYSTQILLIAVLAHLWLDPAPPSRKARMFTWLMCGVAVFHHYTIGPLALLAMYRARPREGRDWFLLPFCAFLGVVPFLVLPFSAHRGLSWGTPDHVSGLCAIMFRRMYWTMPTPPRSFTLTLRQFWYIFTVVCEDISPFILGLSAGTVLLLLGAFRTRFRESRFRLPPPLARSLLLVVLFGPPVALISNFPLTPAGTEAVRVLLLPLLAAISIFSGFAVAQLLGITGRQHGPGWILCAVILVVSFNGTLLTPNSRSDFLAYDYARNMLKSAQGKAVIAAAGGNEVFPLWFVRRRLQAETAVVDVKLLSQAWYRRDLRRHEALPEVPAAFAPRTAPRSSLEVDRAVFSVMLENRGDHTYLATPTGWTELYDDRPEAVSGMLFPLHSRNTIEHPTGIPLESLQLRALRRAADEHPLENRIFYPRYSLALAVAAQALYAAEHFRDALDWAETAYRFHPRSTLAGDVLGSIYLQEGWFDQAETILFALRDRAPASPHLLYNLGLLHVFKNRIPAAREAWSKLSRIHPGYQGVEEKLKKLDSVSSEPR